MSISKKIRKNILKNSNIQTHKNFVELAKEVLVYEQNLVPLSNKLDEEICVETLGEFTGLFIEMIKTYEAFDSYVHDEWNYADLGTTDFQMFSTVKDCVDIMITQVYEYLKVLVGDESYLKDTTRLLNVLHLNEHSFKVLNEDLDHDYTALIETIQSINATNKTLLTYFDEATNTLNEDGVAYVRKIQYVEHMKTLIDDSRKLREKIREDVELLKDVYIADEYKETYDLAKQISDKKLDEQYAFNSHMLDIVKVNI